MKFLDLAKKILLEERKPLTGKKIWQISKEKGYDELVVTEGKTPGNTIHAAIYVDMRDNPHSTFVRVSERPTKFYLQELVEGSDLNTIKQRAEKEAEEVTKTKYSEKDLHALLSYYVTESIYPSGCACVPIFLCNGKYILLRPRSPDKQNPDRQIPLWHHRRTCVLP